LGDLDEAIAARMVIIDAELSADQVALKQRPLRAAITFVKDWVLEVSGDDKRDFAGKPWFAIIYYHVERWYRDHYGPAFERDTSGIARGVVLIRDVPVELRVPLTKSKVETPGETAWLYFPVDVGAEENPLTWLIDAPTLEKLDHDERENVRKDATAVACSLRSIRQYLMGVDPSDDTVNGLLDGVLVEVEAAAGHILHNDTSSIGSALWALQMAVERTLKAFLQHKTGAFRTIHNLFELFDDAAPHGLTADRNLLKLLPRDRETIDIRYGLGEARNLWKAIEAYRAALSVISGIAPSFKRKFNIAGGGLLLARPPWLSLPGHTPDSIN
jgi:hypothetical protein